MKNSRTLLFSVAVASSMAFFACNSNNNSTTATDSTTITPSADTTMTPPAAEPAPVTVSADDSLNMAATDAIKDYPGVMATASNGEVTLTGEIKKSELPKLMKAVNAIHPKKVNNQLTVK